MSKIQQELASAADTEPSKKREETIQSQSYLKRLAVAVADIPEKAWNALSVEAKKWYNAASEASDAGKDLPDFPDLEKPKGDEDDQPRRRRASADEAEPKAYEPKAKDEVVVVTKRGKTYEGVIVEIDEKDQILVLKTEDGEEELGLDRLESIKPKGGAKVKDDEPEELGDPEVGDTLKVTTKRGKVITGKVTEITEDDLVLEDASGEVHEFSRDRLASVEIKVKGKAKGSTKAKDDESEGKGRHGSAKDEDKGGGEKSISVTLRMRQLCCESPDATIEEITKKMKAEGHEFKEATMNIAYSECKRIFGILRDRGVKL